MKNPLQRFCEVAKRHGADATVRPTGRGLLCDFECPKCGRIIAALDMTVGRINVAGHRIRMENAHGVEKACAIIERTLGREHECATCTPPSPTESSPSH